jgi:hypothetical protein
MILSSVISAIVIGACSATVVQVNSGMAATKEKGVANDVKGFATSTPPMGATSMGMMTQPKAGNVTIPITNVEVYQFTANVDPDPTVETMYWAASGDAIYVWGEIDIDCIDDSGASTGETGVAELVYEANSSDYGWMTATDSCGYSTFFGCSSEGGAPEVCGGCDFNADFVVCAASS